MTSAAPVTVTSDSDRVLSRAAEEALPGFNWGAFMLTGLFLLWYGRLGTLCLLILLNVAISAIGLGPLALVVGFLANLWCGIQASEIAWETGRFSSVAAVKRSMRGWNIAALIVFAAVLIVVVIANLD